jgi:Ricin-type beta-trefoil lectin domain-like
LPAHRRPALRGTPAPRRRALTGHRRRLAGSRPSWLLPLTLGVVIVVLAALAGQSVVGNGLDPASTAHRRQRITFAARPADARDLGLVYDGLQPAGADSLCTGSYQLAQPGTCTHGPDPAPSGYVVRRDVPPVTAKAPEPVPPTRESARVPRDADVARDLGGSALTPGGPALVPDAAPGAADFVLGSNDVACEGDGRSGKRVQALYLHEFGTPSRYTDYLGSIRTWAAGVDGIFDASAAETGGSRHVRFVTTPQCRVDVAEVQLPQGALDSFVATMDALQTLGYNRTDRKYLGFADANVYCGIGTYVGDDRPGLGNRNNGGPSYARVDAGCWGAQVAGREVTQMLGAILQDSPHSSGAGGCTDDYDLLCGRDRSGAEVRVECPRTHEQRLDCGHDDYFATNPKPGSYLARNWNVANSDFLLRSDGGEDVPGVDVPGVPAAPGGADPSGTSAAPPPSTAPPVTPPPTSAPPGGAPPTSAPPTTAPGTPPGDGTPGGGASDGGGDGPPSSAIPTTPAAARAQAVLEVRDPDSTSARLSWSAATPTARYDVLVDGVRVAGTAATRARLIGLRPDRAYRVTVRSADAGYEASATVQTPPAARPAAGAWFVLTNSLTGGAADLYAARTANGTPIVLNGSDGDAQEQWKLVPAGGGAFSLRSRATGKCLVPLGGNPAVGVPLVEGDCGTDDRQRWSLQASTNGFTVRTTVGGLVLGVGAQRYGDERVLVLQQANWSTHQSWTAVPR